MESQNQNINTENKQEPQVEIPEEGVQHINNPVLDLPKIEKKYLGKVTSYRQEKNNFYFTDGISSVEVKVVSDEIIRVRLSPEGTFLTDFSYAVPQVDLHVSVYEIKETEQSYFVKTNTVVCNIQKENFMISFEDAEGFVYNEDDAPMHWEENSDFGGYYVYCSKSASEQEAYYGLGDKPTNLNLRSKRFTNWNSDTYSFQFDQDPLYRSIPFYLGLREGKAYGIFLDNTFKTYFDFACERKDQTSFWSEGGELKYYYIHGPHMLDVIKRYHSITGTHYLPPMWALGFHQCRWSYYPESKVYDIAKNFRDRKIPCDAIYLDIDYMDGYRCFTWNKKYFPNPKNMIKELADDGFKTVVIIDPGIKVDDNYWVFKEGKENDYFCRRGDDYFMEGYVWPGRCQFPDFTNPKVREWWGGLFKGLADDGVAGVWNDMNEPAVFGKGTFPVDVRHQYDGHRGSHRKAHNVYGMQMVRATYEGLKKIYQNKRPFTITRAAYAGTQRYASVWTGDNIATWEHLHLGLLQLQRLSVSGMPFCGTDIGGFSGEPDAELFTRWIQFGVFSPFMRCHSAGDTAEREPWSFGEYWENINRKFIELRYQLMPYIYSVFWEQAKYGFPILRPIAIVEQNLISNLYREEEFCFGDKILISPIINAGQLTKKVYLPVGTWYSYWNAQKYIGGTEIEIDTPMDSMPVFVKAGAIIPEHPVMQFVNEIKIECLKLNVYYADTKVKSYTYEDHGDTFAYEQQVYLEKKFSLIGEANQVYIKQTVEGLYDEKYNTYELHLKGFPFQVKSVKVDDREVAIAEFEGFPTVKVAKDFNKILIR